MPRRTPAAPKPVRHGTAYLALRPDGAVLVERRPAHGLLGGMLGFPGTPWCDDPPPCPPFPADWRPLGHVRHTFTHFHLLLRLEGARVPAGFAPPAGAFHPAAALAPALPSVMRKALRLGLSAIEG